MSIRQAISDEMRQAALAARRERSGKSADEILRTANLKLGESQQGLVLARLEQMPPTCRLTYIRAMRGRSMRAGIATFCAMCYGWDAHRQGISACTDPACPLYPYRPYQGEQP